LLGSSGLLAGTSKLASKKTSLMAGIKGVDKGVDTGTVSTVGHASQLVGRVLGGRGGGKLGSVHVELEVSVGGVMGVDEGVEVGVDGSINVVIVGNSLDGLLLLLLWLDKAGSSGGRDSSLDLLLGSGDVRVKGSRVEAISAIGYMATIQDSETILAGGIFNSVCLTIISNIAVLSYTLTVQGCFFSEDNTILLSKSGAESTISGVESLLLQNFGILRVDKLTASAGGKTRNKNKSKHF